MLIPSFVKQLDKTHPALDQATREQAIACKIRLRRILDPVTLQSRRRLTLQIHQLGCTRLQSIGQLVALYASLHFGITKLLKGQLIQLLHRIERSTLGLLVNALRVRQKEHRVPCIAQRDATINGRQEAAAIVACTTACSLGTG